MQKNVFCLYSTIFNSVTKVAQTLPISDQFLSSMQTGRCDVYEPAPAPAHESAHAPAPDQGSTGQCWTPTGRSLVAITGASLCHHFMSPKELAMTCQWQVAITPDLSSCPPSPGGTGRCRPTPWSTATTAGRGGGHDSSSIILTIDHHHDLDEFSTITEGHYPPGL